MRNLDEIEDVYCIVLILCMVIFSHSINHEPHNKFSMKSIIFAMYQNLRFDTLYFFFFFNLILVLNKS